MILPKTIRASRQWGPGTKLIVEDTPDGVLLRSQSQIPPTTMDQVFGSAKYEGPPVSIQDMDAAVSEMFKRKYARD